MHTQQIKKVRSDGCKMSTLISNRFSPRGIRLFYKQRALSSCHFAVTKFDLSPRETKDSIWSQLVSVSPACLCCHIFSSKHHFNILRYVSSVLMVIEHIYIIWVIVTTLLWLKSAAYIVFRWTVSFHIWSKLS